MAESILYITFKDTVVDENSANIKIVVENLIAQLIAAAKRVEENPNNICDYLRKDTAIANDEQTNLMDARLVPILPVTQSAPPLETVSSVTSMPAATTENEMVDSVFTSLKRTHKSEAIVRYFVQNSGIPLSIDQISIGASIPKSSLSVWLTYMAKKIPSIINTSRGYYKFNPNLLITNQ
jgi:hypothetical protein